MQDLDRKDLEIILIALMKRPLEEVLITYNKVAKLLQENNDGAKDEK